MKTEIEIKIKKIRKQLKVHTITEDQKAMLRNTLEHLKGIHKAEQNLIKNI